MGHHTPRFRTVLATAVAATVIAALLAGCAGVAARPPTVTMTRTTHPQSGAAGPSAASPPGPQASPAAGSSAAAGEATAEAGKAAPAGPPATVILRRASRPDRAAATPAPRTDPRTTASGTVPSAPPARAAGTHGTPPASLSTDRDLFAAAVSAAKAAGVTPADPDTPGPESGPPCPADRAYVNEKPTGLRSDVVAAWHDTVAAAARHAITLCLNDGKRSRRQQQAQFDQYVKQYGRTVADELVLRPNESAHVVGVAIDVQPAAGYRWLQATGGALGFCRIYDNEPWHFEFNPAYRHTGCPARLPEPQR